MNSLPSLMALMVGAASFAISYNTLRLEAVRVDAVSDGWPSYLLPLLLDGGVLSGSAVLWKASLDGRRRPVFPFLFVAALVLLSVVVNVSHAGPSLLAQVIAALPPLVLLGCLELVQISHRASAGEQESADTVDAVASDPLVTAPSALMTSAPPAVVVTSAPTPSAPTPSAPTPAAPTPAAPAPLETPPVPASSALTEPSAESPEVNLDAPASDSAPAPVAAPVAAPTPAAPTTAPTPAPAPTVVPTLVGEPTPVAEPAPAAIPAPVPAKVVEPAPGARRQLRVSALAPSEATAPQTGQPTDAVDVPAGDRVRMLFEQHVMTGGDPEDKTLRARFAAEVGASPQYVGKVLKPLREEHAAKSAVTTPAAEYATA